jgi:uncharacterized membrane protein YkvA (DUF1232 family)
MSKDEQDGTREEPMYATNAAVTSSVRDEGFWKDMWRQVRLVWYLIRVIPIDLVPDLIPGLGQLDDLTALIVGGKVFIELAPQHVIARYIDSVRQGSETLRREDEAEELPSDDLNNTVIIEGEFEPIEDEEENQAD